MTIREIEPRVRRIGVSFVMIVLVATIFSGGCATQQAARASLAPDSTAGVGESAKNSRDFMLVTVRKGDTLPSLAAQYLHDPALGSMIADFNGLGSVRAGDEVIIPFFDYERGGLTWDSYQIVPVLSYHKFSLTESDRMTVRKDTFEEQMKFLKDNGYRVITLDQLLDFLDFKGQIPPKSVVITIDDGWRSTYDIAYPILRQYGYPATLFVYTDLITGSRKTLSWNMVKELSENGIDIEQHTKTHRDLSRMNEKESFKEYLDDLEKEFTQSARLFKRKLNKEVRYVAYPYGETNRLVIALLKKLGYRAAFTVKRGGSPFFQYDYTIHRSMIYGDFDMGEFEESLTSSSSEALE